jgi:hypothetical protein
MVQGNNRHASVAAIRGDHGEGAEDENEREGRRQETHDQGSAAAQTGRETRCQVEAEEGRP